MSFETNVGVKRFIRQLNSTGTAYAQDEYNEESAQYFTEGTGDYQCNIGGHNLYTIPANSEVHLDLDWPGNAEFEFRNGFNKALRFDYIKWFYIRSLDENTTNVGIFATTGYENSWDKVYPLTQMNSHGSPLKPGEELFFSNPKAGWVVDNPHRHFVVKNETGSAAIIELAIAGVGGTS